MKRLTYPILAVVCLYSYEASAQVFWTETFDAVSCSAGCNLPYAGINGSWIQAITGTAGTDPNLFYVSCAENGQAAGVCGAGCGSDNSLHVGSSILGDLGAAFYSGDGGMGFADGTTNIRAESPTINCTGKTSITLAFNYIENGDAAIDNAQLWYFDGSGWSMLTDLAKTPLCAGQGLWTAFSVTLPVSADNNPLVKIGFSWINNNDAVGTDPSFAVDDITLSVVATTPPVAGFTYTPASPCVGQTITFTDASTGTGLTYSWTFAGGTPATSTIANPTVTFSSTGPHIVTLTVTNAGGSDTETQTITIVTCAPPVAAFTPSVNPVCEGQCINFTNSSTSSAGSFTSSWTFVGATPSTSSSTNPSSICYSTAGSYAVVLIVTDVNGADTIATTITVNPCVIAPVANFSMVNDTICLNQCIDFTDLSSNAPTTWSWVFAGGASPSSSTLQNPSSICFPTAGSFPVTLTVSNASGTDTETKTIVVVNCSPPSTSFTLNATAICQGQCVVVNNTTAFGTSYTWSAPGATPSSSTLAEPGAFCFPDTSGTFTITLTATNAFGTTSVSQTITVDTIPIVEAFPDVVSISLSESVDLSVISAGAVSYAWETTDTASIGDTTLANVTVTPTAPGNVYYYVYAYGPNGCPGIDSVLVEVSLIDVIAVPNAFSPNGDGVNDILSVLGPGIKTMRFMVYNKYGQQVFVSNKQDEGWDGKHKRKEVDPGVFAYYVEYTLVNGVTGIKKGNVTVVK